MFNISLSTHNYLQKNTILAAKLYIHLFRVLFKIKRYEIVRKRDKHQIYIEKFVEKLFSQISNKLHHKCHTTSV